MAPAVAGFIDPMTSLRAPLQFVGVVHRFFSAVKTGFFHSVSLCSRIGSPPTYMMPEYVSQAPFFSFTFPTTCRVVFYPPCGLPSVMLVH